MRIAFVNPISQTSPDRWQMPEVLSNAQSISVQLARRVAAEGHEAVVVMAAPFRPASADEEVDVRYLPVLKTPLSPPAQLPYMPTLVQEVRRIGPDAVVSSETFQWSTLSLASGRRMPPLHVWHEADTYQQMLKTVPARLYYASAGRRVIGSASSFLPRTERARAFLKSIGVPAEKLGPEIPNGIDETLFGPRRAGRSRRPTILFVGSLIERKNPALVVRALPYVLQQIPDAVLVVKGFGEQEATLRDLSRDLGVSSAVEIDTARSSLVEMPALYNSAWVCVFPSFRDFATLSPLEAVACGVPVVLSGRLSSAAYLESAGCGLSVSDDPVEFAQAIVHQIDAHGSAGLPVELSAPVVEKYSLTNAARRLVDHLGRAG